MIDHHQTDRRGLCLTFSAMTKLLQQAVNEVIKLPADAQDAIASRLLNDLKDEQQWDDAFARTTDAQWDRMAQKVRDDLADGGDEPLEGLLR